MIRPITVICWILALGAGLYLYRAKHEVELMDKHIEQIARETTDIRAESRHLLDEWIRLGEPEQLHRYSDQYLGLKTIAPTQFVRLSDLPDRLPAPRADPVDEPVEAAAPPAPDQTAPDQLTAVQPAVDTDEADAGGLPVPPIPPAVSPLVAVPVVAVTSTAVIAPPLQARPVTPRPVAGQPNPAATRPRPDAETHVAEDPAPKPAPLTLAMPGATGGQSPRQVATGLPPLPSAQGQRPRGLPPLQAQAPRDQGLPPLPSAGNQWARGAPPMQAQALPAQMPQAQTPQAQTPQAQMPQAQASRGQPPLQAQTASQAQPPSHAQTPSTTKTAARPGDARMPNAGTTDPRAPPTREVAAPPPAGSLLGMSRGGAPIPLPAPTPVSATWTGPSR